MTTDSISENLRSLLGERALILGEITLSSGNKSDHYFDCKRVTLNSLGSELVGKAVLNAINSLPDKVGAIGGLNTGADPIIGAVMGEARRHGIVLDGFYVRPQPKSHGTKRVVENAPAKGTNVVIVDDVVTGGGSVLKAVAGAQDEGCNVVAVITLVDRLEGGGDKIREKVRLYRPLYTLDDFRRELNQCQQTTKSEKPSEMAYT
jgi:orotate phosphoribosyltransferase